MGSKKRSKENNIDQTTRKQKETKRRRRLVTIRKKIKKKKRGIKIKRWAFGEFGSSRTTWTTIWDSAEKMPTSTEEIGRKK